MARIAYDPVKNRFAAIVRGHRWLRTFFYNVLDLFFLRSWYVRKLLKKYGATFTRQERWKLLDAGCGFGQYDRFVMQHFPEVKVEAVDVKEDYLDDCRLYFKEQIRQNRIAFKTANLLSLNFQTSFDAAICVDVLEHITDDVTVMKNINHVLKTGGYLIMHSPSIYSEEDADGEESFVDEHARTGYSKKTIEKKLSQAGFKLVETGYTYGKKGHLAWKFLIKYPMLWMNKIKLLALPLMVIYYIFILPLSLILMKLDMKRENEKGTGIYAVARKA